MTDVAALGGLRQARHEGIFLLMAASRPHTGGDHECGAGEDNNHNEQRYYECSYLDRRDAHHDEVTQADEHNDHQAGDDRAKGPASRTTSGISG